MSDWRTHRLAARQRCRRRPTGPGQGRRRPEERELAECLVRTRWSGALFRAAVHRMSPAVRSGRPVNVLGPTATILKQGTASRLTGTLALTSTNLIYSASNVS
jgi:hypothetical protein